MSRKIRIIAALCLIGFTVLVYARAMKSTFQFDDEAGIVLNPSIQKLSDLKAIFAYKPELPRPLFNLSLALDYSLYELNPIGYHLTNLLIHLLAVFLVWRLASEISLHIEAHKSMPIVAAFIFALHPIATETTIYIWSRSSSMMTVFSLASLVLYLRAWRTKRAYPWLIASWAAFILGLLSKEEAIALPGILLATDMALLPREGRFRRILAQAPFWLLPIGAAIYRLSARVSMYDVISWRIPEADEFADLVLKHGVRGMIPINLLTQIKVGFYYLLILLWPFNQSVDHGVKFETGMPSAGAWAGILFMVLSAIVFFGYRRRYPLAALAIAMFFIPLAIFYAVPVSDVMVERRLYLPLAGWAIMMATALLRCKQLIPGTPYLIRRELSMVSPELIVLVLPLVAFSALTYNRSLVWESRLSLWSDVVRVSPDKLRPRVVLARYLNESGQYYRAIHENEAAIRIKPNFGPPIVNLGLIYLNQGDLKTAEQFFRQAVHWHPGADFSARYNLGLTLDREGRYAEAEKEYIETIRINRGHALAYIALGQMYTRQKRPDDAIRVLREAISINPELAEAHMYLGNVLLDQGQTQAGISELEKAAQLAPDDGLILYNLGITYIGMERFSDAEKALTQACRDRNHPEAYFGMAQVRIKERRFDEARMLLQIFLANANPKQNPELAPLIQQAQQILAR